MKYFILTLVAFFLTGCAYIVSKDAQDVSIQSEPAGASVIVTTTGGVQVFEGTTPTSVHLKKKNKYVVKISLDGYVEKQLQIDQSLNPMVIGNLLCGGIPGLIVDGITGAMWNLDPEQIYVTLQMASLNNGPEKLYAVITWVDDNGQVNNIPVPMEKHK